MKYLYAIFTPLCVLFVYVFLIFFEKIKMCKKQLI